MHNLSGDHHFKGYIKNTSIKKIQHEYCKLLFGVAEWVPESDELRRVRGLFIVGVYVQTRCVNNKYVLRIERDVPACVAGAVRVCVCVSYCD